MSKSRSYLVELLISLLHCVKGKVMPVIISDEKSLQKSYKKRFGGKMDLENPVNYCEKYSWFKLNDKNPLMPTCSDKVDVRNYVEKAGYGDLLNEQYFVYNKISEIDINKLPDKFVLKAAHGSHMNLIVTDKSKVNWKKEKLMMWTWLHQNIYWPMREWPYKNLKKRIVAEKFLQDETGELRDYKLFCFNGKVKILEIDMDRFKEKSYRNYYDDNMNLLEVTNGPDIKDLGGAPLSNSDFEHMKKVAEDLAKPFQHVRVDFYKIGEKLYFGEMTFFTAGGFTKFSPEEWNIKFVEEWKLER